MSTATVARPAGCEPTVSRQGAAVAGGRVTLLFRAAMALVAVWELDEGGHIDGPKTQPREYERRVVAFFDEALLETP